MMKTLGVNLTIKPIRHFEVVPIQRLPAVGAGETASVKPPSSIDFEVSALNARVAVPTQRVVQDMVVMATIWLVPKHIEIGRLEWLTTSPAAEA